MAASVMHARAAYLATARQAIDDHAPGSPNAAAMITHVALSTPEGVVMRSLRCIISSTQKGRERSM